jgi:ATP-dependent Clp protease adapter protein ClpS
MRSGTKTSLQERESSFVVEPWHVILLNDDWHTFDEVIVQLIKATGCSSKIAADIAWEADMNGEAICYTGPKERCEYVGVVLNEIDLGYRIERMV